MTASGSPPTMVPADLLIGLLERVPMSEAQIARATLADPATIQAWLGRRKATTGLEAQRLIELVAYVEEMARNIRGDALAECLDRQLDFLQGVNPRDELAGGGYERLIQIALGLTYGIVTLAWRDSSSAGRYFIGAVPNESRLYSVRSCK
ncbi:MAG: hypothetical protein ACXVUE_19305 [Solirubrobacteraceae bacterium]